MADVGKRTNKPMPDEPHLIKLSVAAIKHAREYLEDAEALLDRGRWPAALVDAALGLEEMGKSYMCISALVLPAEQREAYAAGFWKNFDSHIAKALVAQTPLITVMAATAPSPATLFADLEAASTALNNAKFKALYVDVADDGELSEPDEVTEADARAAVEQLGRALNDSHAMGLSFEDADPAIVVEFLAWWRRNGDPSAFMELAETDADAARMLIEAREMIRGDGPVPEWIRRSLPLLFEDDASAA